MEPIVVEVNVGGKIFTTTLQTLSRDPTLLSSVTNAKRDKAGRAFIDRDPTHFRWILNYLRDGYLVTMPATLQERLELLTEVRFFQLQNLADLLTQSIQSGISSTQDQPNTATAVSSREAPTFLTARPSTKGIFFFSGYKMGGFERYPQRKLGSYWNEI